MIGAWVLIQGNTVLGCFPSTITQHHNQEVIDINSHEEKTDGPSRLDIARKFSVRAEISESFKNVAYSKYQPVPQFYFFDRLYGMFCQKQKMADFGDYKNIPRSPFHYSLQIDEFNRGFSNRKPLGGQNPRKKEGQEIGNLEILFEIYEKQRSRGELEGGGVGWGG